jgi:hypothetical protein
MRKAGTRHSKSSPLNCKIVDVSRRRHLRKDARKLIGRAKVLDRELAPLVLMRRANARAPNREQFGLEQYPHKTHQPRNSGDSNQNSEYRCLCLVEMIVL